MTRPAARAWRTNLAVVAASTLVALLACETFARRWFPTAPAFGYPQLRYRPDPVRVFTFVPGEIGFTADRLVHVNERGLRGPVVPYERTPGRLRVLVLGDSIVFGYGVDDDETVTSRLAEHLAARGDTPEVVNAGVPAYDTELEARFLEQEGWRYRPDWIVVGVCWNDVVDVSRMRVSPEGLLGRSDGPSGVDRLLESRPAFAVRNLLKRSRLAYAALTAWRGRSAPDELGRLRAALLDGVEGADIEAGWARMDAAVDRIARVARRARARALLVTFPIPAAVVTPHPRSAYPRRVREIGARHGVPVVDLEPAFRYAYRGYESLFIAYDGDHPNAAGHALAADVIAQAMIGGGAADHVTAGAGRLQSGAGGSPTARGGRRAAAPRPGEPSP
jgi:lysophospholipase L1-like esterase